MPIVVILTRAPRKTFFRESLIQGSVTDSVALRFRALPCRQIRLQGWDKIPWVSLALARTNKFFLVWQRKTCTSREFPRLTPMGRTTLFFARILRVWTWPVYLLITDLQYMSNDRTLSRAFLPFCLIAIHRFPRKDRTARHQKRRGRGNMASVFVYRLSRQNGLPRVTDPFRVRVERVRLVFAG